MPAPVTTRLEISLRIGAGVGTALLLAVALQLAVSPTSRILLQDASAPWIMADSPVDGGLRRSNSPPNDRSPPSTTFASQLQLDRVPPSAPIEVRASGTFELRINDDPVQLPHSPEGAASGWQRFHTVDVAGSLRPGPNRVAVTVHAERGPALLSLRGRWANSDFKSGPSWTAKDEASSFRWPTIAATDQRPLPDLNRGESPLAMLQKWGVVLIAIAVLTALGARRLSRGAISNRLAGSNTGRAPPAERMAFLVVLFAWIALFAGKFAPLPLGFGFDAVAHQDYIDWVVNHGWLPNARDGWATYHPPLFYWLSAAASKLMRAVGTAWALSLKPLPFVAALALAWQGVVLTRRLVPDDRTTAVWAALFAGTLPLHLVLAAYVSNEGLQALLAGAALVMAVNILLSETATPRRLALCSALLGLALLTKFTAALVAAPVLVALLARGWAGPRRVHCIAAIVLPVLLTCGWYYVRNTLMFGTPFAGNWNPEALGYVWWSPPGFHTPAYYSDLGGVLRHPYLSGFTSFGDALYSTFWGDGMLAGQTSVSTRHRFWNYEWMAMGYWLAIPLSIAIAVGFARAIHEAWSAESARTRAAMALIVSVCTLLGAAIFTTTLMLPYFGQARALYASAATPILCFLFASESRRFELWLERRGAVLRWAWIGYLGATLACFFLGFAA